MLHFHHLVKQINLLKQANSEDFEALLRGLLTRIPFVRLTTLTPEIALSSSPDRPNVDWLAHVNAGGRSWMLAVESKRLGQPKTVRAAVSQIQQYLNHLPGNQLRYGILLAPYISTESARICEQEGIGYADLAGNARLTFDQIYIETRSAENPFREKRSKRALFAPRASRVLRFLLQGPLRPWKVTELAELAGVSLGGVSGVRQQLLAHEWAEETDHGIQVTKPEKILESWAKADDWEARTRVREYSVLSSDPLELAGQLKEALGPDHSPHFTQWFAGWLRHPHTTPVVVSAYLREHPEDSLIQERLLGRRVSADGGRLRLIVPTDEGVLRPAQSVKGFQLVSDVQIYLDLQNAGLRAEEQAAELREWSDFSGGWE